MSTRVSPPEPRSREGPQWCASPRTSHPRMGALVSSPECFNHPPAFWGHGLGWGHQASNQSLPPLPGVTPKLNPCFQVRDPSHQAQFPPAFIWEVGSPFPGAHRVEEGLWDPRLQGSPIPVGPEAWHPPPLVPYSPRLPQRSGPAGLGSSALVPLPVLPTPGFGRPSREGPGSRSCPAVCPPMG